MSKNIIHAQAAPEVNIAKSHAGKTHDFCLKIKDVIAIPRTAKK
jgi:hypothetical protein